MRLIERLPDNVAPERLVIRPERKLALRQYIDDEVEDAMAARVAQEQVWREMLRMYEGVPKNPVRNVPIENAPNIEVTLGAMAAESIYAQATDLIWNTAPIVTVRATKKDSVENAKAVQTFVNWGIPNEWDVRGASDHVLLDDVTIGTGMYYTPFVESIKKTKVSRVTSRGPRVMKIPPEDVFVPGGADADVQQTKLLALRFWRTEGQLKEQAKARGWDISSAKAAGVVGWVRSQREQLGRTTSSKRISELYETFDIYCYYDIDGDGVEEDLLVAWDRSSRQIMKIGYNPFDHRPVDPCRYQIRAHLFYGIGVIEMVSSFQYGATEEFNYWLLNSFLANCRLWKAKRGMADDVRKLWPNKVIELDDPDSLKPEQMSDTYPSAPQLLSTIISFAERRAGVNEMSIPRPSQVLGSRTPGITAISMLQQVNRRFTPAFDGMRLATAGAVRQCLYRYQERLLAGDQEVESHILSVMGDETGRLVVDALKRDDFDEAVSIELTASSATTNREADKQNAIILVNILSQYYQRVLELVAIASSPQTPPQVKEVAAKIATAAGEAIERTIRNFDTVRDPQTFIIDVEGAVDGAPGLADAGGAIQQILGLLAAPAGASAGLGTPSSLVGESAGTQG